MAYKALYRTYRPNTFDEVAGQEHIVRTLKNAVEQHKIAHAYLFCGPRGTGKTSIAKIFAKTVNCTGEHQPCMECENCLAVTDGSHPDIVEIDAASNNGVEEVRNLIEKVKYAPIKGKYKVYIIDEVHMMSAGAFNALLKTIEEPPAHVIFILATTEPHKVLPTIISRCQRYDFTKVPTKDIIARIQLILEKEQIHCENEVIRIIAQLSDGGMRDALSILDQCIAYAQNDIKVSHINEIYGILTVKEKLNFLQMISDKNAGKCMEEITRLTETGMDIKRLTMDLINLLKESIIYDYTHEVQLLHQMTQEEVEIVVKTTSIKHRYHMIDTLMDTYDKYRNAASISSYFEICILKMMEEPKTIVETVTPSNPIQLNQQHQSNKNVVQNVSRETLKSDIPDETGTIELDEPLESATEEEIPEMIDNKTAHPLKDEFVLQLLVGANKPEKQADLNSFQNIDEYAMELKWAKAANLLKNGKLMASGASYIILIVGSQAEANEINEKDSHNEFLEFSIELLHKGKKVFAVTTEQSQRVTNNFRNRMTDGTLPSPVHFDLKKVEQCTSKEPSEEERVIELFGKEHVMITED